jgi:hypothetical protein
MKKLGFLMFVLALALMLGGNALAQNVGDNSVYFTTYFANNVAGAPDATVATMPLATCGRQSTCLMTARS